MPVRARSRCSSAAIHARASRGAARARARPAFQPSRMSPPSAERERAARRRALPRGGRAARRSGASVLARAAPSRAHAEGSSASRSRGERRRDSAQADEVAGVRDARGRRGWSAAPGRRCPRRRARSAPRARRARSTRAATASWRRGCAARSSSGPQQPLAQQARAHGRDGGVEDAEQGARVRAARWPSRRARGSATAVVVERQRVAARAAAGDARGGRAARPASRAGSRARARRGLQRPPSAPPTPKASRLATPKCAQQLGAPRAGPEAPRIARSVSGTPSRGSRCAAPRRSAQRLREQDLRGPAQQRGLRARALARRHPRPPRTRRSTRPRARRRVTARRVARTASRKLFAPPSRIRRCR